MSGARLAFLWGQDAHVQFMLHLGSAERPLPEQTVQEAEEALKGGASATKRWQALKRSHI